MDAPVLPIPFGNLGDIRKWANRLQDAAHDVRIDSSRHAISIAHTANKQTDLTVLYNGLNVAPNIVIHLLDYIEKINPELKA
jgi:hypothetical protein